MMKKLLLVCAFVTFTGCAARTATPTATPADVTGTDENLNAVLWVQSAIEYEATALQAFRLAQLQLDAALKDPSWTAALEQTSDASTLPPAVIVDIDETVLDNSSYQARMVRDDTAFSPATWDAWVEEERATAIPGARDFAQYAAARGVTVFYVTNRTQNVEDATRRNLAAVGFPIDAAVDTVLTRGERPEWQASAKGPRRAYVAQRYRVLLLVGDDLGDFVADASGTPEVRRARTAPHEGWWGRRWIMVPNPTYGSWERAIVGDAKDPVAAKRRALIYEPHPR
jgi:5'-nucleotidase (lipoprotein e(P4) family)